MTEQTEQVDESLNSSGLAVACQSGIKLGDMQDSIYILKLVHQ